MKNVVGGLDYIFPLFQFLQNQAYLEVEGGDFQSPP